MTTLDKKITVKEYLEQLFIIDTDFWYETHITSSKPWFMVTMKELYDLAAALDEDVCDIINPKF